MYAKGIEWRRK